MGSRHGLAWGLGQFSFLVKYALGCLSKGNESVFPQKSGMRQVYGHFIHKGKIV